MFRKFLTLAALLSLAALALGFTGRWHPLGDSLAVFRLPNILVSTALIFALPKGRYIIAGLLIILLSAASMGIYYWPQEIEEDTHLRLYQKNLLFSASNRAALMADILQTNPDVITLQEVQIGEDYAENIAFLDEISAAYPHSTHCPSAPIGGVSMFSRWPILSAKCLDTRGFGAIKVQAPSGPLWIVSMHLFWPYPHGQADQVQRALKDIKTLKGPKIIAGDFNMVPWSRSVKSIERASDTHIARPIIHSFDLPFIGLPIPIDHVLLPKGAMAKTERRGKKGSDHYGVLVNFTLPAP